MEHGSCAYFAIHSLSEVGSPFGEGVVVVVVKSKPHLLVVLVEPKPHLLVGVVVGKGVLVEPP